MRASQLRTFAGHLAGMRDNSLTAWLGLEPHMKSNCGARAVKLAVPTLWSNTSHE
jgi:hypothetical protein